MAGELALLSYHYRVDIREWDEDKILFMLAQMQTAQRLLDHRA